MARRDLSGPVCRHCRLPIRRGTGERRFDWLHVATGNVYCCDGLTGLTARFAEPS